jgi:hypothetical protein
MPEVTGLKKGATMKTIFLSLLLSMILSGCATTGAFLKGFGEGFNKSAVKTYNCSHTYGNNYYCQ